MANTDAPFGFRANVHQSGGTPARQSEYTILATYATALFSGDLVLSSGTNRDINLVAPGTSSRVLGAFAGCQYVNDSGDVIFQQYWPGVALADATKIVTCWVIDDPNLEFTAQMSTTAAADIGGVFDIAAGTGSVVTGRSDQEINEGLVTNPKVRVTGLSTKIDGLSQAEIGAFANVRCMLVAPERANQGNLTAI